MLKSQLQSTAPPSSLLNALASGSSSAAGSSSSSNVSSGASTSSSHVTSGDANSTMHKDDKNSTSPPPAKRHKCDPKDMVDVCVGTSVGTITEPDCLGPCEPGTSVTLEGIVWHETEGGVLVVNVTWRGKTYVGTLIDCTKHDWAPPRYVLMVDIGIELFYIRIVITDFVIHQRKSWIRERRRAEPNATADQRCFP